jgi:hypothetical protein
MGTLAPRAAATASVLVGRWALLSTILLAVAPACREPPPPVLTASTPPAPAPASASISFSGQIPIEQPRSAGRRDLDGDGVADCWVAHWEGGSGAGGVILELRAPCGAAPQTIDTTSSFGSFLAQVALPAGIAARSRLVEGVVDLLFGRAHLRSIASIDGSLRWLLEQRLATAGPAVAPFARTGRYTPIWSPGAPVAPPSQVLLARGGAEPRALLAYFAHNHGELTRAASCGSRAVIATRHGVAIHDRGRDVSSWIYVATDAVKLRWPSVGRVACAGELVVIELGQDGDHELFVASPRTGRYGRIPLEGAYSIDARGLTVGGVSTSAEALTEALGTSPSP